MRHRLLAPLCLWIGAALVAAAPGAAQSSTRLLRFPDVHGDRVVFVYAGDLWTAPSAGGTAVRLTAHPGLERSPKFSPDGQWIAFTGQYDGDEQVYVVPAGGGEPRQLTFYPARGPLPDRWGFDNQVYGWTADGKNVFFRSVRANWDLSNGRVYTVPAAGGLPRPLPMPEAGGTDLSPDGTKAVYSPLFRDFRTWKRYEGGWAQELYVFDLTSHDTRNISNHVREDRDPMWIGDTIYFNSSRTGTLNLFAYDTQSDQLRQVTESTRWDVRWPSAGEAGQIIYELGGELHVLDTTSGTDRTLAIHVPDDGLGRRPSRVSAARNVEDFGLAPKAERAVFTARGDVFTAPIEKGPTRNLTHSSNAHDKWATWSPDGEKIAFISDRTGEEELYLVDQAGGEPEQLTQGGKAMYLNPVWAPDGKRIAFSDKDGKVFILTLEGRGVTQIADDPRGQVLDYTWSPHGGHLAFSLGGATEFNSIYVWSVADGKTRRITADEFNEAQPAWSEDGQYLYYLSDREFAPQIGDFEWNYVVSRETGVYALALRKDVPHPFPPESDEVGDEDEEEDGGDENGENGDEEDEEDDEGPKPYVEIDFDGLAQRVARVPMEADNYDVLTRVDGGLLVLVNPPFYYGRDAESGPVLKRFDFEERKLETVLEGGDGFRGYTVSQDGKKVLVRDGASFTLYDVKADAKDSAKQVSTDGLQVDRIPEEEWAQIYDEVWRRFRDFFYVENMHGYDWKALGERYRPLLADVAHRSDLNYVLGELIAELNVGHAYISGGDVELPDRPDVALPGALFELDEGAGRYRLARIYPGHNEEERYRSPLTEIGVDVEQGDYVLAIDGEPLEAGDNPYRLLRYKSNRPVELTVNGRPSLDGARQITFQPIRDESNLRYLNWVLERRRKVAEATDGRVGYLHVPDMGAEGIYEFIKWFYGQLDKEGLIVDVRNNGGGNVSEMIIERLRRQLLNLGYPRTSDYGDTYPNRVFTGPMVALLDEDSASDGDIFPYTFRKAGLGPLIGKRSWGGVVGITNRGPLIDGGQVNVPEFGFADADGTWAVEGTGVEPDIRIENDPKIVIQGGDPQLERAIQEVLGKLPAQPKYPPTGLPPRPEGLDKT